MKTLLLSVLILGLCRFSGAEDKSDVDKRLRNAADVLQAVAKEPDKGIPQEVLKDAKCVAVVPHMLKGGFGLGGQHGRGVATCSVKGKWSSPAFFSLSGGSFGFQIGVEGVDLVMLVMQDQGMQALLSDKFQVGGEASAAAGPVGRDASAASDWKAHPILTYSRTKGAFAGVSLNGAVLTQDKGATKAFYGKDIKSEELLAGRAQPPANGNVFLDAVSEAKTLAPTR